MFNSESGLVKIWAKLVKDNVSKYSKEDIPELDNLREIVLLALEVEFSKK